MVEFLGKLGISVDAIDVNIINVFCYDTKATFSSIKLAIITSSKSAR